MSPVEHDCGHECCPARHDDPHRHLYLPLECPGCIELAKAERPSPEAQALADRTARFEPMHAYHCPEGIGAWHIGHQTRRRRP